MEESVIKRTAKKKAMSWRCSTLSQHIVLKKKKKRILKRIFPAIFKLVFSPRAYSSRYTNQNN